MYCAVERYDTNLKIKKNKLYCIQPNLLFSMYHRLLGVELLRTEADLLPLSSAEVRIIIEFEPFRAQCT